MLEFPYQYFRETATVVIPVTLVGIFLGRSILFHAQGSNKILTLEKFLRRKNTEAPIWLRFKAKINNTKIGKMNLLTHIAWENFKTKYILDIPFYMMTKYHSHNILKYVNFKFELF
jgi:hypothetical protein